jgi:hypothetical protein
MDRPGLATVGRNGALSAGETSHDLEDRIVAHQEDWQRLGLSRKPSPVN